MLTDIATSTFNYAVADPMRRKALAMAIYLKGRNSTSVWKDWSYRMIARECGLSVNTVIRYIALLKQMRLARDYEHKGHKYLELKKLRKKKIKNKKKDDPRYHTPIHSDVSIRRITQSDVKVIERELAAVALKVYAEKTDKVRRIIKLATNPCKYDTTRDVKRARKICRDKGFIEFDRKGRPVGDFVEYGLSYAKMRRKFRCSPNTVKKIIELGLREKLFRVRKDDLVLVKYARGYAKMFLEEARRDHPTAFATENNIYYQPALVFLPSQSLNPFSFTRRRP